MLDQDLSVSRLCKMLGIGKTRLSSDFKKYAGTTIAKFVLNVRMEKAQVLLTTTDLSITMISEQVGFHDYNYFCRVFRKYHGESPWAYRMHHAV
jgi:two-component system response regulator YesN